MKAEEEMKIPDSFRSANAANHANITEFDKSMSSVGSRIREWNRTREQFVTISWQIRIHCVTGKAVVEKVPTKPE
jgi:hypothetical protein